MTCCRAPLFLLLLLSLCAASSFAQRPTAYFNIVNHGTTSNVVFPDEEVDVILTTIDKTVENNVVVYRGLEKPKNTIPALKWMVNDVQNGNAKFGTIKQKAEGYAVYHAAKSGYYGPVVVSAKASFEGKDTLVSRVLFLIPKKMDFTLNVGVGCKCGEKEQGPVPQMINTQAYTFDFHMERTSNQDNAEAVIDDPPHAMEDDKLKKSTPFICNPTLYKLTKSDYGEDMEMKDPHCTFQGMDNRLHFTFQARDPDLPGFDIRLAVNDELVLSMPVSKSELRSWTPQADVSAFTKDKNGVVSFAKESRKELGGGMRAHTKYFINVLD